MAGDGAAENDFRARAGVLTLAQMTSMAPTGKLLELFRRALYGGLPGPVPEGMSRRQALEEYGDGLEDFDEESGEFVDEDEEELDDYELDDDELEGGEEGAVATLDPAEETEADAEAEPVYRTSAKGEMIVYTAGILQRWLHNRPGGALEVGAPGGAAVSSLLCSWSGTVIHALAAGPLTLAELDEAVAPIPEREVVAEHLQGMRMVGQVEVANGGEERYALTDWMREGIAPIAAAARVEIHHPEKAVAPPDVLDVEAAFQLALPLLSLPPGLRGACRLGVQIPGGPPLLAGATAQVADGRVVSSSTLLEEEPETWATGSPQDWLDTLVDPGVDAIETGGDTELAGALIAALHERLFAPATFIPPGR